MERPFASLVDEREVGQSIERTLTDSNAAAYFDFKEDGMQDDADFDRTLLDDADEPVPMDAEGLADGGDKVGEQDPLSAVPGATSFTTIRSIMQSCQRGLVAKKLDASNNFDVSFDLILHHKPKDRRGIAHFAIGGSVGSQVPRICIAPGSSQLVFYLRQGSFRAKCSTSPIPLHQSVRVRFLLAQHTITIDIDGKVEAKIAADVLQIPVPAKVFAYFSGPGDKAADAMIGGAVYRWRHFALRPRVQATTIFELPPDEIQLMRTVTDELKKAKKWASFDAFFGLVVFANAVSMGVQTDCQCGGDLVWQVLDNSFLIAFIVEILLRAAISGCRQFGVLLLTDSWLQFDVVVVSTSVVDTWVLGGMGSGGVYSLARLYRLLKLVKMVRLLRAFRQLAMLVEGILSSLQTLFWAVLLLGLTIFIFGVLLVRMSQWDETASEATLSAFTSLPTAMWTLVRITTFDGWVVFVRTAAFQLGGAHGIAMAVVLLLCAFMTGLGLMNLVVGILCNTAFKLESRQVRMIGAEKLVAQQEALELFRQQISKHGTHLLKNHRFIAKSEFFEALQDPNVKALNRILDLSTGDFDVLVAAFEENGDVEIDGVIEAIGIIELQSYFARSVANSVKKNKASTSLRPVDLLFFCISLRQLEASMTKVERNGKSLCAFAYDALSVLYTRAEKSYTLLRLNNDVKWAPPALKTDSTQSSLDVRKMEETANQFNLDAEEQQLLMPVDVLFGSLIVINGAFVGIQATQDDDNTAIYWIDLGFTMIFTVEFVLRGVLAANLNYVYQSEETDTDLNFFEQANRKVTRFFKLKSRIRFYVVPPCPIGGVGSTVSAMCRSLREFSVLFDFAIIALSLLDSLIIVQLRNAGALNLDTSALSVLRAFRLFRLAKLLRIFKLFPQLQKMVFALIETWRQVFWALVLVLLVLYAFSIYAVSMIGDDAEEGSAMKLYFGDLRSALLTGWQVTTFDHWDEVLHQSRNDVLNLVVLLLVAIALGLGLMNMVIGVLCESALGLQARDDLDTQRGELIAFLAAMKNLQEACSQELGDQLLPSSLVEKATGLKMNPRMGKLRAEHFGEKAGSSPSLEDEETQHIQHLLEKFLDEAGLHRLLVKRIFDKVDHGRTGSITVDDLTKGALVVKEDLAKVELYGCTAALRDVRAKCVKMNQCIMSIHASLQRVLEDMSAVIHRKYVMDPDVDTQQFGAEYDASTLRPQAEKALFEMCKWSGEGSLPHILDMGTVSVTAGTGKISISGDEVVGSGTAFRTEVQVGDIIVVEPFVVQKSGDSASKKTLAVAVAAVLSQSRLKIATFVAELLPDDMIFVVSRSSEAVGAAQGHSMNAGTTAVAPKQMSPRSAQHLFEWDLQTQRRDIVNLREAEAQHMYLQSLKREADFELLTVLERPLLRICFQAWKSQLKLRQKTVSLLW
ncbi:unnamed protein product [Effrenium voratum]|uniref:Ion transport domain-containing protein n=1 Tax=Effrenium voratum TaxID=2562239 RepID=A0AA36MJ64_9DINO|nr:unnamed protein product [Effrenium voratum]CAJ1416409.1 unnamed protein product [Effrenium voratum]